MMLSMKTKLAAIRWMARGLSKVLDWSYRRGKITDEKYEKLVAGLEDLNVMIERIARGEQIPEPVSVDGLTFSITCPACGANNTVRRNLRAMSPESDVDEKIPHGWERVPLRNVEETVYGAKAPKFSSSYVTGQYACPDCAPFIREWMDRHGLDHVPHNRIRSIGSTLEAAMLGLAEDLDAEGHACAAERIRAELVVDKLGEDEVP